MRAARIAPARPCDERQNLYGALPNVSSMFAVLMFPTFQRRVRSLSWLRRTSATKWSTSRMGWRCPYEGNSETK
jgi:hypothetical protein